MRERSGRVQAMNSCKTSATHKTKQMGSTPRSLPDSTGPPSPCPAPRGCWPPFWPSSPSSPCCTAAHALGVGKKMDTRESQNFYGENREGREKISLSIFPREIFVLIAEYKPRKNAQIFPPGKKGVEKSNINFGLSFDFVELRFCHGALHAACRGAHHARSRPQAAGRCATACS